MDGNDDPRSATETSPASAKPPTIGPGKMLMGLAAVSWLAYLLIAWSGQSLHEANSGDNSLLLQLGLFGIAFACYLAAIRTAVSMSPSRWLLGLIVVPAIAFRLTLLFSDPIEEIDIYRYLWDGAVLDRGISPFRYSPRQILEASSDDELPDDLRQLVALRESSPSLHAILGRIHFGDLPTIYPPVSQAVFAAVDRVTPPDASVPVRMRMMRAAFIGFDLCTLLILLKLLQLTGLPLGWAVAHAWCPLVVKEIANSGHLDSLATLLSVMAVYLALRCDPRQAPTRSRAALFGSVAAACTLAFAVGAKLYPVILLPVLFAIFIRQYGWRMAGGLVGIAIVLSSVLIWPMMPTGNLEPIKPDSIPHVVNDEPPLPPEEISLAPKDPSQSLRAFLGRWEMNDFLFLIVIENLRPTDQMSPNEVAWFSIMPRSWRIWIADHVQSSLKVNAEMAPFLVTRVATSIVFASLAMIFAWRAYHADRPVDFLNAAFLTVAWFWLLLPTLNPWYWTWAVPFLPFSRNRAWLAVSGLVFAYYLRFWLVAHFPNNPVLGTGYNGALFFDYVITWAEFGPWFCWLAVEYLLIHQKSDDVCPTRSLIMVKDPVCGMEIKPEKAAGKTEYNGQTYHFCSTGCKQKFDQAPEKYAEAKSPR